MPPIRKLSVTILLTAAVSVLAACSNHSTCVDEKSMQEYTNAFVNDMIAAAGRVSPADMRALQSELDGISKGDPQDFAGFCTRLDGLRKKYGI